ncbi:MAG: T9SS type A sorting domain-containing protein, partial [Ferruginibacter sp.]|nr:T9SS type A sorting domain-containing protein [Cytophagales bacterium]
ANGYYRDNYLAGSYRRTGAGTKPYPQSPKNAGSNQPWSGLAAIYPGSLLMFGQMEGRVAPHANRAPVVNAGPDQTIALPLNQAVLVATASDGDGYVAAYQWTQLQGPAVPMSGDRSGRLGLTNLTEGEYAFRLVVKDNQNATAADEVNLRVQNLPPTVNITAPGPGATLLSGTTLTIRADAYDRDGTAKVAFFQSANGGLPVKIGEDFTSPYSVEWRNVGTGDYGLTAQATDQKGTSATSEKINVTVTRSVTGTVLREYWTGVTGTSIASLPLTRTPSGSNYLTQLEGPVNFGDQYGSRLKGYLYPPMTGSYVFWIAGDGDCELRLSRDENPVNLRGLARVTGGTGHREWTRQSTQQSAPVTLVAGGRYYVEVLQKESTGADHVSVGWRLPSGALERPVPGGRLSPPGTGTAPLPPAPNPIQPTNPPVNACAAGGTILRETWSNVMGNYVSMIPLSAPPTSTGQLALFETPAYVANNFGTRLRGYLCAPETGNYTFWIASDVEGQFFLSTNEQPANKVLRAWVMNNWTNRREWYKLPSQQSVVVRLEAGRRYYVEALEKAGGQGDHVSVGWRTPSMAAGSAPVVIPGAVLSPFATANARKELGAEEVRPSALDVYPNPFPDRATVAYTPATGGKVTLQLYDLRGRMVSTVFEGETEADKVLQLTLDGRDLQEGVYVLRLSAPNGVLYKKVVFTR